MGSITGISLKSEQKGKRIRVDSCHLVKDLGIVGDRNFGDRKNISILGRKVREHIDESKEKGFCMVKFYENFTIDGFVDFDFRKGSFIHIGECSVEIVQVGKKCYSECPLFKEGKMCPISDQIIFGNVSDGGFIEEGDDVWIEF